MIKLSTVAIAVVVLVSFFDNFSQFPVIAPYARSLGADPGTVGLVVAVYSVTNLGGNVLAGYFLDRFGRKRLLVLGLVSVAAGVLLYAAARGPAQLILVRGVHGLAAAILAPAAFTLLGDLFPREKRGRAMGVNGALIAMAAMVAPALGGAIRDRWGFAAVFATVAALLLGAALLAQLLVRETHRPEPRDAPAPRLMLALLGRRPLTLAYLAAIALTFGLGTIVTYLPLYLEDQGYGGAQTGASFSAFALLALVVMASPVSRAGDVRGRVGPLGLGLLLAGLGLSLVGGWPRLEAVLGAMALYGLGFGLIFPAANALVADATLPRERGTAFGLFYAFYSLGVVMGATASGAVAGQPWVPDSGPFLMAGVVALLSGGAVLSARSWAGSATASADGR